MKRFTIVLITCGFAAVAAAQVTPEDHAARQTKDQAERRRLLDQHR